MAIFGGKNKSKSSSSQTTNQTSTSTLTDQSRNLLMNRLSEIQGQEYQALDPNAYEAYLSPYQDEVIAATTADINAARGEEANAARQAMLARNALGASDRRGVAEAELSGRYDRTLASTIAGLRQAGFNSAQDVASRENANANNFQGNIQAQINQLLALLANDRTVTSSGTASGTSKNSGYNLGFSWTPSAGFG